LVKAARFEQFIASNEFQRLKLDEIKNDENAPKLPLRAVLQLSAAPEEKWQSVYEEYTALDNGTRTPEEAQSWVRVARSL
jgi:hypothetical protein